MTNSKNKKSSKQKRVLVASVVLAGLIVAGGTFAWFTSKDEVTNKLTASNNYGVSIVEDFTPPSDWTPGQDVNKDVSVTNTGNVDAFVKVSLSSTIDITTVTGTDTKFKADNVDKYVTLSNSYEKGDLPDTQPKSADEVKAVQAGGRVVCIAGKAVTSENEEIADGTDFTPTTNGLYVFERDSETSTDTTTDVTTRISEYDGYYYNDGTYYDITDITKADDGNFTYKMLTTETLVGEDMTFDYTQVSNNLITARYNNKTPDDTSDDIVINIKLVNNWTNNWYISQDDLNFYYQNTLKAGETSKQLIDSLELSNNTSPEAYQKFEYNLKITADSVQVVKDETGKDTADAVNAQTDWISTYTLTYDSDDKTISGVTWNG